MKKIIEDLMIDVELIEDYSVEYAKGFHACAKIIHEILGKPHSYEHATTEDLVAELRKREGTHVLKADPGDNHTVIVKEPTTILLIAD